MVEGDGCGCMMPPTVTKTLLFKLDLSISVDDAAAGNVVAGFVGEPATLFISNVNHVQYTCNWR